MYKSIIMLAEEFFCGVEKCSVLSMVNGVEGRVKEKEEAAPRCNKTLQMVGYESGKKLHLLTLSKSKIHEVSWKNWNWLVKTWMCHPNSCFVLVQYFVKYWTLQWTKFHSVKQFSYYFLSSLFQARIVICLWRIPEPKTFVNYYWTLVYLPNCFGYFNQIDFSFCFDLEMILWS